MAEYLKYIRYVRGYSMIGDEAAASWTVKAFLDHNAAVDFKEELNDWCIKHRCWSRSDGAKEMPPDNCHPEQDPGFVCHEGGVSYQVERMELADPEYGLFVPEDGLLHSNRGSK